MDLSTSALLYIKIETTATDDFEETLYNINFGGNEQTPPPRKLAATFI